MSKFTPAVLTIEEQKRLSDEADKLVWIPLRNKVREEIAKEIKEKIQEIWQEYIDNNTNVEAMYNEIIYFIDTQYLYLSYYTKWK